MKYGIFHIRFQNFSSERGMKINQLKANLFPLTDEKVIPLDENILSSYHEFCEQYPQIERFENKQNIPGSLFHLSSFYNTKGGVDSERENSIPSKLPEGVEFQVYDRKTLEEKFKYMDGVFGKGTCEFFVELFTLDIQKVSFSLNMKLFVQISVLFCLNGA